MNFNSSSDRNFDDLVGYQNGNGATASYHEHNGYDASDGLLDPEDFQDAQAEQPSQRSQLWAKNPLAKLGIVGGGTAVAFLLLGVVLTNIFNDSQPTIEQSLIEEVEVTAEPEIVPISEEGQLKTALALSRQADQIEEIKTQPPKTLPTAEPVQAEPPALSRPVPRPAPRIEPRREVRPAPLRTASRPAPAAVRVVRANPTPPPTKNQPAPPQLPPIDPVTEWERLAQVGSYGKVAQVSSQVSRRTTNRSGDRAATAPVNRQEEATILTGQRGREIAIGTVASGILETPIVWEGETQQQDKFIVRLEDSVVGADGKVILPPDTLLLTEVPAISGSGLVQMSAVAAIVERDGQQTQMSLPSGGIQIRGEGGSPLLAEQYFDPGSEIASLETGLAVLSGIGRAAELFNRSDQKVVVNDNGIISATENSDPDLVAGFIEGGADVLIPQISARNQRAINEALKRNNFWTINAGTPVQIFVNQKIRL